jgi:hypothetical protein
MKKLMDWSTGGKSADIGGKPMSKKQAKVGTVMGEFKRGDLKSSSGQKVTNPKQAVAIAMSEAGASKKGNDMNRMKSKGEHPVQKKAKKGAEMVKMAKGGGVEIKGKTKGKMVKMAGGGKACK